MTHRILIVDDSIIVRQQIGSTLKEAGHEIVEAGHGEQALLILRAQSRISLVICDVNMPVMNGIALLEALKREGLLATCKVLMLTSEAQPDMLERARKLGARGWIVKPVSPKNLVTAVRKLLQSP